DGLWHDAHATSSCFPVSGYCVFGCAPRPIAFGKPSQTMSPWQLPHAFPNGAVAIDAGRSARRRREVALVVAAAARDGRVSVGEAHAGVARVRPLERRGL